MSNMTNRIQRLRATADFLAVHRPLLEGLEDDGSVWISVGVANIGIYIEQADTEDTPVDQKSLMREIRQGLNLRGVWEKSAYSEDFNISHRDTETGLRVTINANRTAVCEKRVIGTEEKVIPAIEARPEKVETVEIVEWDCGTLLSDDMADSHHTDPDDPDTPEAYSGADFSDLVGDETEA